MATLIAVEAMSDWKRTAAARRDARHTASEPTKPTHRAKKDRKRWCRGKVGVEHKGECRRYDEVKNAPSYFGDWRILVCVECGKELDLWMPPRDGWPLSDPKPEWVTL